MPIPRMSAFGAGWIRKIITRDAKHKALSARQPFPTACLEEEEKNKKEKGEKKINKNLNPATYRDLSWQLSKKKKKTNPERRFQLSPCTTPRMSEQHLRALQRIDRPPQPRKDTRTEQEPAPDLSTGRNEPSSAAFASWPCCRCSPRTEPPLLEVLVFYRRLIPLIMSFGLS